MWPQGKQVGRPLTGLVRSSKAASARRQALALLAVVGKQTGVGIWSTESGNRLPTFNMPTPRSTDWLMFAGPDRLVIAHGDRGQPDQSGTQSRANG
jgi:hypothetical protein